MGCCRRGRRQLPFERVEALERASGVAEDDCSREPLGPIFVRFLIFCPADRGTGGALAEYMQEYMYISTYNLLTLGLSCPERQNLVF